MRRINSICYAFLWQPAAFFLKRRGKRIQLKFKRCDKDRLSLCATNQKLPENPSLGSCRSVSYLEPLNSLSWSKQSEFLASSLKLFGASLRSPWLDSDICMACVSSQAWGLGWTDASLQFTATEYSWLVSTCICCSSIEDLVEGRRERRQSGQVLWLVSQWSMQSIWNVWPQAGICWSLSSAW